MIKLIPVELRQDGVIVVDEQDNKIVLPFSELSESDLDWDYLSEFIVLPESFIREFYNHVNWDSISKYQLLSEQFIRDFKEYISWYELHSNNHLLKMVSRNFFREFKDKISWYLLAARQLLSEDFIEEFQESFNKQIWIWTTISEFQVLSEDFIRRYKDKVCWKSILSSQVLSIEFIKEFKPMIENQRSTICESQLLPLYSIRDNKENWLHISFSQQLTESFIREFSDRVSWYWICRNQKLSEDFIREFKHKVDWRTISHYQILSQAFMEEFIDQINIQAQYDSHHDKRTLDEKRQEMADYADKFQLKFENDVLHTFRTHDVRGTGYYNKTIFYNKPGYYRDWHCDLNPKNENSCGFGIFPVGNTPIQVKVEDWGCKVEDDARGKARVWGFTIPE